MNTKENNQMLNDLGKGFIVVPRSVIKWMYNEDDPQQQKVWELYFILYCFCYHTDGQVKLNGNPYTCRRGEYIGKQQTLARLMNISEGYTSKLLKKLEQQQLIAIQKLDGGSRIRVIGYNDFVKGKFPEEKKKKAKESDPKEAFARYLKAINEGQYINRRDF